MPKRLVSSSMSNIKLAGDQTVTSVKPFIIPSTFTDGLPLPSIIVFDLDVHTMAVLEDAILPITSPNTTQVDTHVSAPIKPKDSHSRMVDRWGESFTFYAEVPAILYAARQAHIPMSLASRTSAPELAREMLRGLVIPNPSGSNAEREQEKELKAESYFIHPQIYPGSKVAHFRKIQNATRNEGKEIKFEDMLFLDDEARNRNVESELGVTFCLVSDGVDRGEIDRGINEWRRRRGHTAGAGRVGNGEAEL